MPGKGGWGYRAAEHFEDESEEGSHANLEADSADGWDDDSDEAAAQRTRGLFDGGRHDTPASALGAAAAAGFDFRALERELGLEYLDRVKVLNFVRTISAEGADPAAATARVRAREWDREAYLAPVLEDDPLLWALDDEAEDGDSDDAPPAAAAAAASPARTGRRDEAQHRDWLAEASVSGPYSLGRQYIPDPALTEAYRAVEGAVRGASVLDVQCGFGVVPMLLANAGAARVLALEPNRGVAARAAACVSANGLPGKVSVLHCGAGDLEDHIGAEAAKVDVLVGDWMGPALLLRSAFRRFAEARRVSLREGGIALPSAATLFCAGASSAVSPLGRWADVAGLDLTPAVSRDLAEEAPGVAAVTTVSRRDVLTATAVVRSMNMAEVAEEDGYFDAEFDLVPPEGAADPLRIGCLAVWFDLAFAPPGCPAHVLSTSPDAPPTRWGQTVLVLPEPVWLRSGTERPAGRGMPLGSTELCAAASLRCRLSFQQDGSVSVEATPVAEGERGPRQEQVYRV